MNFTRQAHPTIIERVTARLDAHTKINAHGFPFLHRDSDLAAVALAPGHQSLALLDQMNV